MTRKLMLSSLAIAATTMLLGAGTFAKFTDTEQSQKVTVTAGTLDLVVGGTAAGANFDLQNAQPGSKSQGLSGFVLTNNGTLPGQLRVFLVKDVDEENTLIEPETDATDIDPLSGEIDNFLNVMVDGNTFGHGGTLPAMGLDTVAVGDPLEITSMIWGGPGPIIIPAGGQYPGGPAELWFGWEIPADATNAIMSDSLGFHVEFRLDQV